MAIAYRNQTTEMLKPKKLVQRGEPWLRRWWVQLLLLALFVAGVMVAGRLIEGTPIGVQIRYLIPPLELLRKVPPDAPPEAHPVTLFPWLTMLSVPFARWLGVMLTFSLGLVVIWTGLALLRLLFLPGYGPMPIARLAVREALTNRGLLFLGFLWLLALAVLPAIQGDDVPLRYRVQSNLRWGMFINGLVLGLITILFTTYSVTEELRRQRAFTVFSKPVRRISYLGGKFLAVIAMTAVLTLAGTLMIHASCLKWLGNQFVTDQYDLYALGGEVLTARERVLPVPPFNLDERAEDNLREAIERDGRILMQRREEELFNDQRLQELAKWKSIGPGIEQTYLFKGMKAAKETDEEIILKFKLSCLNLADGAEIGFYLIVGGERMPLMTTVGRVVFLPMNPDWIDDQGTLTIGMLNPIQPIPGQPTEQQYTYQLDEETRMAVLWKVGGFFNNLFKAALYQWVRTVFLAMLALVASSFCAFSVASLLCISIWVLALFSGGLEDALGYGSLDDVPGVSHVFNIAVIPILTLVVRSLSAFSRYDAVGQVLDGIAIPAAQVRSFLFWVGVIWTGLAALLAAFLFQKRELAKEMS